MKRHEAIAPLSRDHHGSLILARLLKKNAPLYKGLPQNAKDKIEYARQQFKEHIKKHFQQEEIILSELAGLQEQIDSLAAGIMQEHEQLTRQFESLDIVTTTTEDLDRLGSYLEDHIRKEERVLFPLLQEHCPEDMLTKIYVLLH